MSKRMRSRNGLARLSMDKPALKDIVPQEIEAPRIRLRISTEEATRLDPEVAVVGHYGQFLNLPQKDKSLTQHQLYTIGWSDYCCPGGASLYVGWNVKAIVCSDGILADAADRSAVVACSADQLYF